MAAIRDLISNLNRYRISIAKRATREREQLANPTLDVILAFGRLARANVGAERAPSLQHLKRGGMRSLAAVGRSPVGGMHGSSESSLPPTAERRCERVPTAQVAAETG